ncbi:TRAP transporter substrate-binding protein [Oceanobacillus timonensis]|uniref:TRAP transporter substrate-binding protein n=1 Tax=Oceanobacillus timonensis TaxID=1926285 RepID=UPI0009BB0133|nr:TRAP transporter substrate-binding protein [Oceanobacillus timonensis]
MRKVHAWIVVIGLGLIVSGCQSGEASEKTLEITFGHNQPLMSPEHAGAEAFEEYVESHTDNVDVNVYPASQLGSLREQVEATQLGEIQLTMQPTAMIAPFVDDIKVVDLPYLWPPDTETKYKVLDSEVGDEILATLDQGGFEGLGFWPGGYKLITTSNREIHEPSDLEGVTIRTMESPLLLAQYKQWGANPVPVPYSEVYNSLQLGIVDGQENPLQTVYLNNYHEVQENIVETYHGTMTYAMIANQDWYNDLPSELQEILVAAEEVGRNEAREVLAENEAEYRAELEASDKNFYSFTEEEIETFREASLPVHETEYNEPGQQELLQKIYDKIEEVSSNQ